MQHPVFTAIGLISGTSMDAIDIALLRTDGYAHIEMGPGAAYPYPADLKRDLLALLKDPSLAMRDPLEALETRVTTAFGDALIEFLRDNRLKPHDIDLLGLHGQTVFHKPEARFTRQLGDGALLAQRMGISVINRFRHKDVEAGGQGAPLVPLYHAALAASLKKPLMVLNLGGVANVTSLGEDAILAFDCGPASALIDDRMRRAFGLAYDKGGAVARRGRVDEAVLNTMLAHPFFAQKPPKSLDRNAFHGFSALLETLKDEDAIATLTAFTIAGIVAALSHIDDRPLLWLVAGGGRENHAIMAGLRAALQVPVEPVEAYGWDGDMLEAQCFAYLAIRSQLGLPLSLPGTTGVPQPMSGGAFWPKP